MKILRSIALLAALVTSTWTQAGVIYDESVSGDLSPNPTTLLALSAGTNRVLGSSQFGNSGDFDSFRVSLTSSQILTSIEYLVTRTSFSEAILALSTTFELASGDYFPSISQSRTVNLLGSPLQSLFGAALPLAGSSTLDISNWGMSRMGDINSLASWDYEFRFHVATASVPEPGIIFILGAGLFGLLLVRRRPRRFSAHLMGQSHV